MKIIANIIPHFGAQVHEMISTAGFQCLLFVKIFLRFHKIPSSMREMVNQMYSGGVKAFPVVTLVAFFAGMILSFQTGLGLAELGQAENIGSITAVTMAREMGPFITAIILAAAVGSSLAAEIGTMAVSEEILALEVMSIDPIRFLVLPRVIALALMCPILTAVANLVGIFGGGLVSDSILGVDQILYTTKALDSLRPEGDFIFNLPKDVYTGLIKAVVYGFVIAGVSCGAGLDAKNGAAGVGEATRRAVRNSIILILVFNYLMSWAFYR